MPWRDYVDAYSPKFGRAQHEELIKICAKIVRRARYVTFQMAEVAVPRELFTAILEWIQRFGVPPPLARGG